MELTIRTFGRIHGKKLSTRQAWLVDNMLPALIPNPQFPVPKNRKVILEIGFGAGEHLMHIAQTNPESLIVGAEPYMNGTASLLSHMAQTGANNDPSEIIKPEYRNIRIWPDDVRKLLSIINHQFSIIYILHPDPWPKARHEKRRLLSSGFLGELARHLTPDGRIIISTDHGDYFDWILEQLPKTNLKIANDSEFTTPPEMGLDTRYKKKDMFGANKTQYLVLIKK